MDDAQVKCMRTRVAVHSKLLLPVGTHILAVLSLDVVTNPAGATHRARTCIGCVKVMQHPGGHVRPLRGHAAQL